MKRVTEYQLIDHGIEASQYFQGCGTSFTCFNNVVTGIGDNFAEALQDALESIAQDDVDSEALEAMMRSVEGIERGCWPVAPSVSVDSPDIDSDESSELYYHVSIRYNTEETK